MGVADLEGFLYTALLYQAMTNRNINAATSLEQYSILVKKEQQGEFLHGWLRVIKFSPKVISNN